MCVTRILHGVSSTSFQIYSRISFTLIFQSLFNINIFASSDSFHVQTELLLVVVLFLLDELAVLPICIDLCSFTSISFVPFFSSSSSTTGEQKFEELLEDTVGDTNVDSHNRFGTSTQTDSPPNPKTRKDDSFTSQSHSTINFLLP